MLFHRVRAWPAIALVVCCLCAAALPAAAQELPAAPPVPGALPTPAAAAVGPDQFGYIAEPVAPEWVDATGGTDLFAPFSGSSENFTKTVTLPFAFPFYENRYDALTVTASGYLAFAPAGVLPAFGGVPNNAVAAYAAGYYLSADADGKNGRVFTLSRGTAPNRTFVVEWHGLGGAGGAVLTFQAVLHEGGDILFQYGEMDYGGFPDSFCAGARIVDAPGWDGLQIKPQCEPVPAHSAWRIARPAEGAHLFVYAPPLGSAAPLGGEAVQEFLVRNTGSIPDRFNLVATSALPVRFLGPDGAELADGNGDGLPDSGPLAVGEVAVLGAAVQFPPLGNPGRRNEAAVQVLSARNAAAAQRTLSLSAVVPYAFAQPFCVLPESLTCAGVRVLDVRPTGARKLLATLDDPASNFFAFATRPNAGYVAVWTGVEGAAKRVRSALLGLDGARAGEMRTLAESSDPAFSFEQPVAAVAPDGSTGVAWVRIEFRGGGFEELSYYRADVFFAVLGPDGAIAAPPVNVTNNQLATGRFKYLRNLDIAAVGGGFALGWNTVLPPEGWSIANSYDVYLALLSGSGALLRDVITVSDSAESYWGNASDPSVAALTGDRVVVAYDAPTLSALGVGFTVFSSAGDRLLPFTALIDGAGARGGDAVEVGGGSLLFAWDSWDDAGSHHVAYSLLDAGDYSVRKAATPLPMSAVAAAVMRDGAGNGIISAQGDYTGGLTAAAVNPAGDVVMPPTNFADTAVADLLAGRFRLLATPGAIAHPLAPTSADKADLVLAAVASGGVPGRIPAAPAVAIVNRGALTAQGGTLTAVLDPALTYAGAIPEPDGMAAAADGTTVTWALPDLDYLGGGTVVLLTNVPSATVGSSYPVTFTLTTPTPVLDPAHGQATAQATVAAPTYMPFVVR